MNSIQNLKNKSPLSSTKKIVLTASYLALSGVAFISFSAPSFAMMEEDKGKGTAPTKMMFQEEVGNRRWDKEVKNISDLFRTISRSMIEEGLIQQEIEITEGKKKQLASMIEVLVKKWENSARSFFKAYKNIHSDIRRKKVTSRSFFDPLFDFIVEFEDVYDILRSEYLKRSFNSSQLEESFLVIQTAWNRYMENYKAAVGKELSQVTPLLGFSKVHSVKGNDGKDEDILKHLAYLRDSKGILLFMIFPHEHIQENLYCTYIPYGKGDLTPFEERSIFFYNTPEGPIIVENSGYHIVREEGHVAFAPYTGKDGTLPFVLGRGLCVTTNDEEYTLTVESSSRSLHNEDDILEIGSETQKFHLETKKNTIITNNLEDIKKNIRLNLPPKLGTGHVGPLLLIESHQKQLAVHATTFFSTLLKDSEKELIVIPKGPAENLEAEYILLLDYIEQQKNDADNKDVQYLQAAFPGVTLEEAISALENIIVENAVHEEQKKINAEEAEKEKEPPPSTTNRFYQKEKT